MNNNYKTYHGIRVVPYRDENGVMFGGFEGTVIARENFRIDSLEWRVVIAKMVVKNGLYSIEKFEYLPDDEGIVTSGKSRIKFWVNKAYKFASTIEDIAISSELVYHLEKLDESWIDTFKANCFQRFDYSEILELSWEDFVKVNEGYSYEEIALSKGTSFLEKHRPYHGIKVIPHFNLLRFEGFEGIVISGCNMACTNHIIIFKMEKKNGKYYSTARYHIPEREIRERIKSSGEYLLKFLLTKAKTLSTNNEEIAISKDLEIWLCKMDSDWSNAAKFHFY